MTDPRIAEGVKLLPELQREKANRIAKHFEHARDDIIIAALTAAGEMVGERQDLAKRLQKTTERMANNCSVDMEIWGEHSNACLEAVKALSAAPASPVGEDVEKRSDQEIFWNEINQ